MAVHHRPAVLRSERKTNMNEQMMIGIVFIMIGILIIGSGEAFLWMFRKRLKE